MAREMVRQYPENRRPTVTELSPKPRCCFDTAAVSTQAMTFLRSSHVLAARPTFRPDIVPPRSLVRVDVPRLTGLPFILEIP